jgi:hypothetical protein
VLNENFYAIFLSPVYNFKQDRRYDQNQTFLQACRRGITVGFHPWSFVAPIAQRWQASPGFFYVALVHDFYFVQFAGKVKDCLLLSNLNAGDGYFYFFLMSKGIKFVAIL